MVTAAQKAAAETQTEAPKNPNPPTPAVHTSILNILRSLSVEKGAVLPSNMGGKPYITAADINQEIKRKFVEEGLIFLPNERIVVHKEVINNQRIAILISVEGQYTIISTKDGSSVSIGGIGDGLANGTAVASNIASTNALKNALLRTFLITEQSVEDAAKNGIDESAPKESRAVAAANNGATAPATTTAPSEAKAVQAKIKDAVKDVKDKTGVEPNYTAIGKRLNPEDKNWATKVPALNAVLKAIQGGEVS